VLSLNASVWKKAVILMTEATIPLGNVRRQHKHEFKRAKRTEWIFACNHTLPAENTNSNSILRAVEACSPMITFTGRMKIPTSVMIFPILDSLYSKGTLIHLPPRIFLSHWYSKGLHCSEQVMRYANPFAINIHSTMWLASRSARLAKTRR
jgi:hypothetical protein